MRNKDRQGIYTSPVSSSIPIIPPMRNQRLVGQNRVKRVRCSSRVIEILAPDINTLLPCRIPRHLGTKSIGMLETKDTLKSSGHPRISLRSPCRMPCLHPRLHELRLSTPSRPLPLQIIQQQLDHCLAHQAIVRISHRPACHRLNSQHRLTQIIIPCMGRQEVRIISPHTIHSPVCCSDVDVVIRAGGIVSICLIPGPPIPPEYRRRIGVVRD